MRAFTWSVTKPRTEKSFSADHTVTITPSMSSKTPVCPFLSYKEKTYVSLESVYIMIDWLGTPCMREKTGTWLGAPCMHEKTGTWLGAPCMREKTGTGLQGLGLTRLEIAFQFYSFHWVVLAILHLILQLNSGSPFQCEFQPTNIHRHRPRPFLHASRS